MYKCNEKLALGMLDSWKVHRVPSLNKTISPLSVWELAYCTPGKRIRFLDNSVNQDSRFSGRFMLTRQGLGQAGKSIIRSCEGNQGHIQTQWSLDWSIEMRQVWDQPRKSVHRSGNRSTGSMAGHGHGHRHGCEKRRQAHLCRSSGRD